MSEITAEQARAVVEAEQQKALARCHEQIKAALAEGGFALVGEPRYDEHGCTKVRIAIVPVREQG